MSQRWSPEHAERHLLSLELFGMRFGLDRMRRMMTALGSPERGFDTIHVVGTNGKTSTTRMIAAILERHGLRTGSYLSPHLTSYAERVQLGERDIETHAFAAAIAQAAWAAERVNRTLSGDDHVTQFELLTAAALWELERRGAQVAIVEAGLGGRYDATNVIDSKVAVLTNVGLEHTRWLGPTVRDIAAEKLAVLGEGSILVVGEALEPELLELARETVRERGARLMLAPSVPADLPLGTRGSFQRANFALARAAAEAYLEAAGIELREEAVREAAGTISVPGRMQVVADDPLTILDGAHNPAAAAALAASLPEVLGERHLGLVLGVLDDKDAAGMLAALLPHSERAWFTAPPSPRALPAATLQSLARQLGFERAECVSKPADALVLARRWARERSCGRAPERGDSEVHERSDGGAAVLATGSVYLVGDLLSHASELELTCSNTESPLASERGGVATRGSRA